MPDAFGKNSYSGNVVDINSGESSRTGSGFVTNTSGVSSPSYGGGDGGGGSMLQMKVNKLESDMVEVKSSLKSIEGAVQSVERRITDKIDDNQKWVVALIISSILVPLLLALIGK